MNYNADNNIATYKLNDDDNDENAAVITPNHSFQLN